MKTEPGDGTDDKPADGGDALLALATAANASQVPAPLPVAYYPMAPSAAGGVPFHPYAMYAQPPMMMAPGPMTPGPMVPGHMAPGPMVPGHMVPGHMAPGHMAPGHMALGHMAPGHMAPGHMMAAGHHHPAMGASGGGFAMQHPQQQQYVMPGMVPMSTMSTMGMPMGLHSPNAVGPRVPAEKAAKPKKPRRIKPATAKGGLAPLIKSALSRDSFCAASLWVKRLSDLSFDDDSEAHVCAAAIGQTANCNTCPPGYMCRCLRDHFQSTANSKRRVSTHLFWKNKLGLHFPVGDVLLLKSAWSSLESCERGIKQGNGQRKISKGAVCINPFHYVPTDFLKLMIPLMSYLHALNMHTDATIAKIAKELGWNGEHLSCTDEVAAAHAFETVAARVRQMVEAERFFGDQIPMGGRGHDNKSRHVTAHMAETFRATKRAKTVPSAAAAEGKSAAPGSGSGEDSQASCKLAESANSSEHHPSKPSTVPPPAEPLTDASS